MKGKAIIFSAPSGAGKTTIVKKLIQKVPNLKFSISATTRKKRPNEIDGKDYYFLSVDDFNTKAQNNELLEWEEVYEGLLYGTLKREVEKIWQGGSHAIFDVDVKGGLKLKQALGESALSIFVHVDNPEILRERLVKRQTESEETLNMRVEKALIEMQERSKFDEIVKNEVLEEAVAQAETLVKNFID